MADNAKNQKNAEPPAAEEPKADAAEQTAQEQPSEQPAEEVPAEEQVPEQSVEEACAELGIKPDKDGNVEVELLVSLAGVNVKAPGENHGCDAAEAVRMVRAGFAKPRG